MSFVWQIEKERVHRQVFLIIALVVSLPLLLSVLELLLLSVVHAKNARI